MKEIRIFYCMQEKILVTHSERGVHVLLNGPANFEWILYHFAAKIGQPNLLLNPIFNNQANHSTIITYYFGGGGGWGGENRIWKETDHFSLK